MARREAVTELMDRLTLITLFKDEIVEYIVYLSNSLLALSHTSLGNKKIQNRS